MKDEGVRSQAGLLYLVVPLGLPLFDSRSAQYISVLAVIIVMLLPDGCGLDY
jgi:hypothetical protein